MNYQSSAPTFQSSRSSTCVSSQQSTHGSVSPIQNSRSSTSLISQQSTLIGTTTPPTSDPFRSAVIKFRNKLSGDQLTDFKTTTFEGLYHDLLRKQQEQESVKKMMNLSRVQSCLEAMRQFGETIEVFLNVADAIAFVWGPMKFLLLTASNFTESFDTLLNAYEMIGENMPMLKDYEQLFQDNPHMTHALELMYTDILEFHQKALQFFSGKVWKRIFRSMWRDFESKFNGILQSLQRHKELIENRASLSQYHRYRTEMAEMKTKLDKMIDEEQRKKLTMVKDWLFVGCQQEQDHESFRAVRREFPSTGGWILGQESIKEWIEADAPTTSIAWINGIPGAGKTILASTIVDECAKRGAYLTSYFYCHYEDPAANNAVTVLKGLISQLLDQCSRMLGPCLTRRTGSGESTLRSLPSAKKLFEDFCLTIPKMFVIIDGLDECDLAERKQLLEFLVELVGQCDGEDPGKLRVLFVSQNYSDIRRALLPSSNSKPVAMIASVSSDDNEQDIRTYVSVWVDCIARHHAPIEEETVEFLRNLTMARAKGMFLYAKLVMTNLYHQPTREHLFKAISLAQFPDGLEQAYERIVRRIKETLFDVEWRHAQKLLGWMVCCKRQLTWREMQVALSINVDQQSIDFEDRRSRKHIYETCGSLVQVTGDRVALVHSTAKEYITKCTKDIRPPSVECEMAALCLQYLTFPCFDDTDNESLRVMMLQGYFAFQDYAVATWFHHVNAFVKAGRDLPKENVEVLREIAYAVDVFLQRHEAENWCDPERLVEECRQNCKFTEDPKIFDELVNFPNFHDELVALTSHIYLYQSKGFKARHKISIKSLETALERNRTFLEEQYSKLNATEQETYKKFYDHERRFKCTRITCTYFSEGFKDAKSRNRHINIHERPYHCAITGCLGNEGFTNQTDLDKHKRLYHPDTCDLAERFNTTYTKQTKTEFSCSFCGKSFTRRQIQLDHEKSHRGERPHGCPECGKAFTRKNDLTRHRKLHDRK